VVPLFRKKGLPVIWVYDRDDHDEVVPGNPRFELVEWLHPQDGDLKITKMYGNAFTKTELGSILEAQGVDTLIIAGFSAEYCVLSTYRGALDLDLTPVLLHHGTASEDRQAVEFVEKISTLVSYAMLAKILE
jgi:nicotinamidase-related amidase